MRSLAARLAYTPAPNVGASASLKCCRPVMPPSPLHPPSQITWHPFPHFPPCAPFVTPASLTSQDTGASTREAAVGFSVCGRLPRNSPSAAGACETPWSIRVIRECWCNWFGVTVTALVTPSTLSYVSTGIVDHFWHNSRIYPGHSAWPFLRE